MGRAQTNVAWMRKVEYMSNEAFQANPIAQYKSRSETKANYRERAVNQDKIDDAKSEEQKIADIERTFTEPRMEELRHPDPKKRTRKGMQKLDRFIGYLMPKKDQVAPEASAAEDHEAAEDQGKPYDWCRNFTFT